MGRKTKFTAQHKTTQGRRHGETERRQKILQDTGEEIMGENDGEETNSKEKQDEGEPGRREVIFHFFYSSTTVYSH